MPSYEELLQFWKVNARPMRCNSIHCESQCCAMEKTPVIEEHKTQGPPPPPQPRRVPTGAPLPWSDAYLKLMEKIGDITQLLWSSGLEYRVYSKVEKMLYNTVEELYPEVIDYRQEFIKDVCIIPETLSPFPRNKPKTKSTKSKKEGTKRSKKAVTVKPSAEHHGPPPQIARPRKRQAFNDNGLYQCEYCERTFPTPQGIQSHITLSHSNMQSEEDFDRSTGMHKCQFCRRLFPQEHGLKTHISCTHLQKVYKCPECGKGFPKKYAMIRHRSTHVNKDFMPQKCPYCDAMVSVRYYKSHIFTRHLYKTFKCEDCHQTFNNQDQFHKHLWTHPMKKYRCDQCPMSFNASYKLDNHQKTHEADNKALGDFKDDEKVQELLGAVECGAVEEFEGDIAFNEIANVVSNEVMVTS